MSALRRPVAKPTSRTLAQREIAEDELTCHCGVQELVPQMRDVKCTIIRLISVGCAYLGAVDDGTMAILVGKDSRTKGFVGSVQSRRWECLSCENSRYQLRVQIRQREVVIGIEGKRFARNQQRICLRGMFSGWS